MTDLPIIIKGIQTVADAVLAAKAGVDGIIISNHGGRSLEYSLPSIEVLYRLRKERPDVFDKMEVYMDGGVRRGTDVLKALCLGAKAVGLGRPFLYAQSAYGEAGVVKIIRILEREIITGMRLLGAPTINDLVPEMVEKVDWEPLRARL
jgi:L-lactate dehydrogenase (cytochrome)